MRSPASLCVIAFTTALLVGACDRPGNVPPVTRPSEPGPEGGPPPESAAPKRNSFERLEFPLLEFGQRALPQRAPMPLFHTC